MELKNLAYILLLAFLAVIQVILSLKTKTGFYSKARYWGPSVAVTALLFLMWQINLVKSSISNFNPEYTIGLFRKEVPIEEWIFYLLVPFFIVFIYELVKTVFSNIEKTNLLIALSLFLVAVFGLIAFLFRSHYYTFFVFLFTAVYLGYIIFRNQFKHHLTYFYLSFILVSVPLLIIDGFLTGLPVAIYNPEHILQINLFSIPVENVIRFYLMALMVVTVYELLEEKKIF